MKKLLAVVATVAVFAAVWCSVLRPHEPAEPAEFEVAPSLAVAIEQPTKPRLALPQIHTPPPGPQVSVPRLGVNAGLTAEPLTQVGYELLPPADARLAAIWSGSARLSAQTGTTLLAGHVQTKNQPRGAFFRLSEVQPGDLVITVDEQLVTRRWRVTQLRVTPKSAPPSDVFSTDGPRQLVLVTCTGPDFEWNAVVYAVPDVSEG